jgi:chemotaxis protein methyltransferase CheR
MSLNLAPFKRLIKAHCGLLLDGAAEEEKLALSLKQRAAALSIQPADYYKRLHDDANEFQELVNLLTINETYFFREPEQIRLLVDRLAPRFLVKHGGSSPVRILSAGCSSGEEPYTLVMALIQKYGESVSSLFSVAGGDIDSAVLNKARDGRYGEFSFRGVPAAVKSEFFDKDGRGYQIKDKVRNLVGFHELNLLAPKSSPALSEFDIIFFRNVSIYFDADTRQLIQKNLASLLKEDGLLVIGTAETLANDLGVLPMIEEDGLFYFFKGKPPLPDGKASIQVVPPQAFNALTTPVSPPPLPVFEAAPAVLPVQIPAYTPPVDLAQARALTCDKRYDEALPYLDAFLAQTPDHIEASLLKAHVLINRKDFIAAEQQAQQVLANDPWSIDAFIILGLAAKWRQQTEAAISWFKQAAYASHECWPAHYYLADLYRNNGDMELARRAYRAVVQLLSASEPDAGIRFVPLSLPAGEVRFLCEHQLAKLPGAAVAKPALVGKR